MSHAPAEAQAAAIADDIAYNAHDIDDGLRAQLFDVIDLGDVPLAGEALTEVLKTYPKLERSRIVHETVRRVISAMVTMSSPRRKRRLKRQPIAGPDAVRARRAARLLLGADAGEEPRAAGLPVDAHVPP